jgi:uncharacterized membrane protein YkoI
MKSRRHMVFGLLGLLALACAPLPAAADKKKSQGQGGDSGGCLPLKRVMQSVSRQYNARVLDAGFGGNGVYVIRLLTNDGRVLDVVVDCASGQVMGVHGG